MTKTYTAMLNIPVTIQWGATAVTISGLPTNHGIGATFSSVQDTALVLADVVDLTWGGNTKKAMAVASTGINQVTLTNSSGGAGSTFSMTQLNSTDYLTTLALMNPYALGSFPNGTVLQIGSEKMLVTSGGNTVAPTVQRGYSSTTTATHAWGATVTVVGAANPTIPTPTTLSGNMTSSQTTTPLTSFTTLGGVPNGTVLLVGTEQMLVTANGGTLTPTVTRGYNGTTAATHSSTNAVTAITTGTIQPTPIHWDSSLWTASGGGTQGNSPGACSVATVTTCDGDGIAVIPAGAVVFLDNGASNGYRYWNGADVAAATIVAINGCFLFNYTLMTVPPLALGPNQTIAAASSGFADDNGTWYNLVNGGDSAENATTAWVLGNNGSQAGTFSIAVGFRFGCTGWPSLEYADNLLVVNPLFGSALQFPPGTGSPFRVQHTAANVSYNGSTYSSNAAAYAALVNSYQNGGPGSPTFTTLTSWDPEPSFDNHPVQPVLGGSVAIAVTNPGGADLPHSDRLPQRSAGHLGDCVDHVR